MAHVTYEDGPNRIPNGTKVEYTAINGAKVKGIIIGQGEAMVPAFQEMRVTSHGNPSYPFGTIVTISTAFTTIRK